MALVRAESSSAKSVEDLSTIQTPDQFDADETGDTDDMEIDEDEPTELDDSLYSLFVRISS